MLRPRLTSAGSISLVVLLVGSTAYADTITTVYDPGLGTFPEEQGFVLYDDGQPMPYEIVGGELHHGPTEDLYNHGWHVLDIPFDFMDDFEMRITLKVDLSTVVPEHHRAGYTIGARDVEARRFFVWIGGDRVFMRNAPDSGTAPYYLDTTAAEHVYLFRISNGTAYLYIDPVEPVGPGDAVLTLDVIDTYVSPRRNTVWFGDGTVFARSETRLSHFSFTVGAQCPADPSTDCNANAVADVCDILIGSSTDCNGNGIPDECDLLPAFDAASSWTTFDPGTHQIGVDPDGYIGAVSDGRYIYFAPHYNGAVYHGEVLRHDTYGAFDDPGSWMTYDYSSDPQGCSQDSNCVEPRGFADVAFDGHYVYFAPHHNNTGYNGEVLRYDTSGAFDDPASWTTYDPGADGVGVDPDGYAAVVFDGKYLYFSPDHNDTEHHGEVLRYDTAGVFDDERSWSTYDYGATAECAADPNCNAPDGYDGVGFDGQYVYFVPHRNNLGYHGEVLRLDTQGAFDDPASWMTYDYGASVECAADPDCTDPDGYTAAEFDGRYVYFSPYRNGQDSYHGEVLRFDSWGAFGAASSWDVYTPGDDGIGADARGYGEVVLIGQYVYFAPYRHGSSTDESGFHGEVLRHDMLRAFDEPLSWETYDYGSDTEGCVLDPECVDPDGYSDTVFDGRYLYFVPNHNGASSWHGEVLRFDTTPRSPDCNSNSVPDECDIADGTSEDGNGNGVPDECEGPANSARILSTTVEFEAMRGFRLATVEFERVSGVGSATIGFDLFSEGRQIEVLPTTVDAGVVPLAGVALENITITNIGYADLTVLDLVLAPASGLSLFAPPAVPFVLSKGQSQLLTVRFAPQAAGPVSTTMSIQSDDEDTSEVIVTIDGEGGTTFAAPRALHTSIEFERLRGLRSVSIEFDRASIAPRVQHALIEFGRQSGLRSASIEFEWRPVPPLAAVELQGVCEEDTDCLNTASCIGGICYVPKNRYVSIAPNPANAGTHTARRVSLDLGDGETASLGWVGEPAELTITGPEVTPQLIARIVDAPHYRDWSIDDFGVPWVDAIVQLGDCEVSPQHLYLIQSVAEGRDVDDEAFYSDMLALPTTALFADVVGGTPGTPPDGVRSFADINAVVRGFQNTQTEPKAWLDFCGSSATPEIPDFSVINFCDINWAIAGFQGATYPFAAPCECASPSPCPVP